jgi:hypothetical protein
MQCDARKWILVLVSICFAQWPFDKYGDNGPIMKSLTEYATFEHREVKKAIDREIYPTEFNWEFCSFSAFPIFKGQRCPYFEDYDKYRSINDRGSTAYIQDQSRVYVGIRYWFSNKGVNSDTSRYRIVSYEFQGIKDSLYQWVREKDLMTITTKLGEILYTEGETNYSQDER